MGWGKSGSLVIALLQLHFTSQGFNDKLLLLSMFIYSTDCGQADAGTAAVYDETGKLEQTD